MESKPAAMVDAKRLMFRSLDKKGAPTRSRRPLFSIALRAVPDRTDNDTTKCLPTIGLVIIAVTPIPTTVIVPAAVMAAAVIVPAAVMAAAIMLAAVMAAAVMLAAAAVMLAAAAFLSDLNQIG